MAFSCVSVIANALRLRNALERKGGWSGSFREQLRNWAVSAEQQRALYSRPTRGYGLCSSDELVKCLRHEETAALKFEHIQQRNGHRGLDRQRRP
jgi:hypothetical protein